MIITIPDNIIDRKKISEKKLKFEFACFLYHRKILSLKQAAKLCETDVIQFQKELTKRNIYLNYDISDLETDLQNLKSL